MAAEAAVSFAVETLGNLLIQKAVFLKGVKGEVEWLRNELKSMQCFLKDAANKQGKDDTIRNWIARIREVAHDAADAIEMFVVNVESREQQQGRCACFHPDHVYHLNKIGKEIESIRKRLTSIEETRRVYGIQSLDDHQGAYLSTRAGSQVESWRRVAYWQKDDDVVGLEEDVEELVEKLLQISVVEEDRRVKLERKRERERRRAEKERRRQMRKEREGEEEEKKEEEEEEEEDEEEEEEGLLEERKGHSVAAIVGMGGIGKSTLASTIYNHPGVADRFESRAWVVVSSQFTLEDIIKQIMHQLGISLDLKLLGSMNDGLRREEILQKELHKQLQGKLYFIVLDDLWETQHWESLRKAFPQDRGSRLMLTSRNQAMTSYSDDYVYEMKLMDAKRSWKLFLRKAFIDNSEGKCPEELKDIGEEILKKCDGLPLAISVVGGLLLRKRPCRSEWLRVLNDMKFQLDTSGGDIDTISAILELSYQNLLPELQACFLCLGFFKEDAVIKAKNLVHIWVAQGLVKQQVVRGEETMEDVARDYLNELISRNMVQVKESRYDQVKACHMHDLIRDLCLRKAKEEINFEVLTEDRYSHHYPSPREPRHRAIYSGRLSVLSSTRNRHVRSLFIYGEIECNGGRPTYWKSFELLRILDLGNARFQVWPKAIGGLVGLRYLKMIYNGVVPNLPRSWAKLKNLQVLDLGFGFQLLITDKVILEMDSLRHLYAYINSHSKIPLGNLRNLQTLCWVVLEDSNLWQVTQMTGVTKLGIDMRRMSDASELFTNLVPLENLVNLTLIYHVSQNLDGLDTLPRVTQLKLVTMGLPRRFPPNLSHLTLSRMRLTQDPMPVLEKLPKLLYLKLRDAYVGEEMVVSRRGFPSLKVLGLQDNMTVKNIRIEEGAMPELKQLMIRNCKRLVVENLPEHLKSKISGAD